MARGGNDRHYAYNGRRTRSDCKGHDEQSDKDYIISENEVFDESEDDNSFFLGDTSEESLGEYEDKEKLESKRVKKVVRKSDVRPKAPERQKNKVVKRRKRKRVVYREEDDNDDNSDDDDDDDEFTPYEIDGFVKRGKRKRVVCRGENDDDDGFTPYEINGFANRRKRKQVVYREDNDNDDCDDDDDKEFTPNEVDGLDDEEDELPMKRGKNKLGKPQLPKDNGKGVQRKRTSKVSKKITRKISKFSKKTTGKKPRQKRRVKRNSRFDKSVEKKTRKNTVQRRRRRRITIDSDSDFVSSGSSDLEYTISEEEREQVKEGSKFCRGLRARSLKNLSEERTSQHQKKRSLRKDKKVEELSTEARKQICGICLSEEGKKTVCGTLNCCNHYFCFACIMEWSKVESRCPLCKKRFITISKPAKSSVGFDSRTVAVQVPERDQVYEPSEEELRGYLDPYENVICTECQQGGDDALMLLCDICDSPAHTYCVGLGHEVPEGNWYCEGCKLASPSLPNPQNPNPTPEGRTVNNFSVRSPLPIANLRDTFDLNEMYVPDTPLTQEAHRNGQSASPTSGYVASTVSDRRRIHLRINQLINNRTRQVDNRNTGAMTSVTRNNLFDS